MTITGISLELLRDTQDDPTMRALSDQIMADFSRLIAVTEELAPNLSGNAAPMTLPVSRSLRLCAHEVKGLCLTLGLDAPAKLAARAETAAADRDMQMLRATWPELLQACSDIRDGLQDMIGARS